MTLTVRGPSHLGLTSSISSLLMPWLLPGHQQQWYWLCEISKSGLIQGRISITFDISVWRNDIKCKLMFKFPLKNLARKELNGISLIQWFYIQLIINLLYKIMPIQWRNFVSCRKACTCTHKIADNRAFSPPILMHIKFKLSFPKKIRTDVRYTELHPMLNWIPNRKDMKPHVCCTQ